MKILELFSKSWSKLSLIIILPSTNFSSSEYNGKTFGILDRESMLIEYKSVEYLLVRISMYLFFQLIKLFLSFKSLLSNLYISLLHISINSEKLESSKLENISFSSSELTGLSSLLIVWIKSFFESLIGL